MFGPEERRRAVDLYSATPMTTARVVRHLGYPAGSAWNAGWQRIPGMPAIWRNPSSTGDEDQGDRTGAGRFGAVRNWVKAYREGGMAALRPKNRNVGQTSKPAMRRDRDAGDAEALRRRIEEPELGNAVMREVVEARRKRPGRRPAALSNRERTLPVDRLRPTCSLSSMTCLPGIAPSSRLLPPRQARG